MERRRAIFGIIVVAGGVAAAACNLDGKYDSGGSFGSSGFTSTSSGRGFVDAETPSARSSICDTAVVGGRCDFFSTTSSSGTTSSSSGNVTATDECEIGDDPNPLCNTRLECQSQRWEAIDPPAACVHNCPSSLILERDGGCEGSDAKTLRCEYPDEAYTCGCEPFYTDGGIPDAGNPGDAGKTDGGKKPGRIPAGYKWACVKPAAGCPRQRPRLGAACVKPLSCDYGRCVFEDGEEDGLELRCYGRSWERQTGTYCP